MAGVVTSDYVDGHEYEDVLAGFEIRRVFRVTGLTDTPDRQLIEAVLSPGIPLIGETYPGTSGILVNRRNVRPDGPNAARVTCTYSARQNVSTYNQPVPVGNDGQDVKQISSGVREVSTTVDAASAPMLINPPALFTGWDPYLSEARVFVAAGEIVFERVETTPAAARARALVGTLNDATIGAYSAKTLLFWRLDAQSNDGGRLWDCVYTFRYDAGGWMHRDRYHAPDGKVPEGAAEVAFDILGVASFTGLDLDFSDSQTPIT